MKIVKMVPYQGLPLDRCAYIISGRPSQVNDLISSLREVKLISDHFIHQDGQPTAVCRIVMHVDDEPQFKLMTAGACD